MTTERIYYTDASCITFEASVTACVPHEGGGHAVCLDRTAFYPTSGGQPFDTGQLGGVRVIDVVDEDTHIVHVTDAPLEIGARVSGVIDWPRRFDHMQQHTGQHVLSAAFERVSGNRTESFHLGADSCSIDLAREVTTREVQEAVAEANRVVWEDRPVSVRLVSGEEAAALPLRKPSSREGPLRLVEVHDFDLSACGGTHVARTGSIGIIVVPRWERFRGGARVEFLCGGRVQRRFDAWRDALAATLTHLSVAPEEMAGAVERLQDENKTLHRSLKDMRARLAAFEAQELVARGTRTGNRLVVVEAVPDADAVVLKAMASAAAQEAGAAVALFSTTTPALVVVACHASAGVDAGAVLKALVAQFGGKGGGRPELAQGGGLQASTEDLTSAARDLLSR